MKDREKVSPLHGALLWYESIVYLFTTLCVVPSLIFTMLMPLAGR